ncbi:hypothetical protein BUY99_13645 [Staphylococcus gallinarum]|uniref:hypothetical protein n=1 Tax=Staphylococcus TaxID=1279 RepID=UPI000E693449|nr:hypothetical protein [Staphylococcus gallinarum]RIL18487.1 hypothetical protein BUY99_13645 [Staphylococcus gallinarum]
MSCFVHEVRELNILGKYLKEEMKVEKNLADHIIINFYSFENTSVNNRYQENNKVNFRIFEDEEYEALELINEFDALCLLDSIRYQCSEIESEYLKTSFEHIFNSIVTGILKHKKIEGNYKDHMSYTMSTYW